MYCSRVELNKFPYFRGSSKNLRINFQEFKNIISVKTNISHFHELRQLYLWKNVPTNTFHEYTMQRQKSPKPTTKWMIVQVHITVVSLSLCITDFWVFTHKWMVNHMKLLKHYSIHVCLYLCIWCKGEKCSMEYNFKPLHIHWFSYLSIAMLILAKCLIKYINYIWLPKYVFSANWLV
jgi:hypothetical protein